MFGHSELREGGWVCLVGAWERCDGLQGVYFEIDRELEIEKGK